MTTPDYTVLLFYVAGVFVIGVFFGKHIKSSSDMFAAGKQSPWWVAGLSGFMTMFSAGTFVVWGSIAYEQGLVAVVINLTYGVAALLVGWFVAGRWRRLGISSVAEFLELRFGRAAVIFCTVANMLYKLVTVGVALYSVAVILAALIPLPAEHLLVDAETKRLGVSWAVLGLGVIIVLYTVIGGLWAVLMTDVLQFIVLMASVAFVVPLMLLKIGGLEGFAKVAPEGFLHPTSSEWTWWVLVGWCATQFFMIGAEWAFVQRYLCVPTERDARKGAWLFGALYLVSPMLWMLPPMIYRGINPSADPKEAYILACQLVLPAGMTGLVLAAMFSATASMVDSQLNVFAGVLTNDFYRRLLHPNASQAHLVTIGRFFTTILGAVVIVLALLIPRMGGATDVVVAVTALLVGPLLLPTLWGLFSHRVNASCIWGTVAISFGLGAAFKFGLIDLITSTTTEHTTFVDLVAAQGFVAADGARRMIELSIGVIVPLITLLGFEFAGRAATPGWRLVQSQISESSHSTQTLSSSRLPAQVVSWSVAACGCLIGSLAFTSADDRGVLLGFGGTMCAIGAIIYWASHREQITQDPHAEYDDTYAKNSP